MGFGSNGFGGDGFLSGRLTIKETIQFIIIIFTMCLMLSKHYHTFEKIFSMFYMSELSFIAVIVGGYSVLHGMYMVIMGLIKKEN